MVFKFLNGWKKSKEYHLVALENYMKFKFSILKLIFIGTQPNVNLFTYC